MMRKRKLGLIQRSVPILKNENQSDEYKEFLDFLA